MSSDKWAVLHHPDGGITVVFYDPDERPLARINLDAEAAEEFVAAVAQGRAVVSAP